MSQCHITSALTDAALLEDWGVQGNKDEWSQIFFLDSFKDQDKTL